MPAAFPAVAAAGSGRIPASCARSGGRGSVLSEAGDDVVTLSRTGAVTRVLAGSDCPRTDPSRPYCGSGARHVTMGTNTPGIPRGSSFRMSVSRAAATVSGHPTQDPPIVFGVGASTGSGPGTVHGFRSGRSTDGTATARGCD